jgi:hypothetical protein
MGVDLTKDFFFSYTYCLARSLQCNHLAASRDGAGVGVDGWGTTPLNAWWSPQTRQPASGTAAGSSSSAGGWLQAVAATMPGVKQGQWTSMFVWNGVSE